jgi:uncharacterized protein YkwD
MAAALNQTNFYRARHGSPPLTEDATIRRTSQDWADYLSDSNSFDHNDAVSKLGYGENLAGNYAEGSASTLTAAACASKKKIKNLKTSSRGVFIIINSWVF